MLIDWSTVIFQLLNFAILVWLLKRFLYKPILKNMDKREQRIADRLQKARDRENEAAKEKEHYRQKTEEIEDKRQELLKEAEQKADQHRENLFKEAREEADEKRRSWKRALDREKEVFLKDLAVKAGEAVFRAMEQALKDLADGDIQERLVAVFADKLRAVDDATRSDMMEALESGETLTVRSAFELGDTERGTIRKVAAELFDREPGAYETDEGMIAGVAVEVGGREVAWSVRDYLNHMRRDFEQVLEQNSKQVKEETGDAEPGEQDTGQRMQTAEAS